MACLRKGGEDLDIAVLDGNELDLNELAREQILLALPERLRFRM